MEDMEDTPVLRGFDIRADGIGVHIREKGRRYTVLFKKGECFRDHGERFQAGVRHKKWAVDPCSRAGICKLRDASGTEAHLCREVPIAVQAWISVDHFVLVLR